MNRNGYWVRTLISGRIATVVRVVNSFDEYIFYRGKWELRDKSRPLLDLGWDDDWDCVSKEEALKAAFEMMKEDFDKFPVENEEEE